MIAPKKKVAILGLDGATLTLLGPWADAGHLPTIARLRQEGTAGVLLSTIPWYTAPAWMSIYTGVNPAKHGIFGFTKTLPHSYDRRPVSSRTAAVPKIWQLASAHGATVGVVNAPLSYPADPVNGYMVTGMLTPDGAPYTFPPQLAGEMEAAIGGYIVNVGVHIDRDRGNTRIVDLLRHALRQREKAIHYLLDRYPTDLLFAVFVLPDRLHHLYWKYLLPDSSLSQTPQARRFRDVVLDCYRELDAVLGRLLARLGPEATTFLISDHGFGEIRKVIYLNRWLSDQGLLAFQSSRQPLVWSSRQFNLSRLKRLLPLSLVRRVKARTPNNIDWSRTQAYVAPKTEQGIYLNLRGRDPLGVVPPEEYEPLRTRLIHDLLALRDPEDGGPLVERVLRKEEAMAGPFLDQAPDLFVVTRDQAYHVSDNLFAPALLASRAQTPAGLHYREGVFMAHGPGIARGARLDMAHVTDVAPTALYALGAPVPRYMDGRVLTEVFEPAFRDAHPLEREDLDPQALRTEGDIYQEHEVAQVMEHLKGLGYL